MVCGGSNTIDSPIKLFRFPTSPHSLPNVYRGHTSPVLDVSFGRCYLGMSGKNNDTEINDTSDIAEKKGKEDNVLFTVGGNDMCIFQWRVRQ